MRVSESIRIGELARLCGVSDDTIRHYERKGVITGVERDGSGYRRYAPRMVERVLVVRRTLAIGFRLDELARIFAQRDAGVAPCRGVRELAATKLTQIEERIADLIVLRDVLRSTIAQWDERLTATIPGIRAHLTTIAKQFSDDDFSAPMFDSVSIRGDAPWPRRHDGARGAGVRGPISNCE